MRHGSCMVTTGVAILLAVLSGGTQGAEVTPDPGSATRTPVAPAVTPAALTNAREQFQSTCSACHGADARGGRGGAPDLLLSPVVMGDAVRFREAVRTGSPTRGMPGFPLEESTLDAMRVHLLEIAAVAKRRGNREIKVVGNPTRGKTVFEGPLGCSGCHSVTTDLRGIGARYSPRVLQGRIVMPRGSGVHPGLLLGGMRIPGVTDQVPVNDSPVRVTVTPVDAPEVSGVMLAVSDFHVALRDAQGRYRSFSRNGDVPNVVIHDPAQPHIDRLGRMSDRDLHDLTAYLASLR
ncbi:MAG: c-type cytochrome [Pseudomonadota bacterium]